MERIFFDNWMVVLRTLIIGVLAYISLIILLRLSGKRTLSKMNAFDLVVTVALGSTLASILLSKDVALVQGVLAFALLIGLQFIITWSSMRANWVRRLVTGEPRLLFYHGQYLHESLHQARVAQEEINAAVRGHGFSSLADVEAVVLETDGSFSVVQRNGQTEATALAGIKQPESMARVD